MLADDSVSVRNAAAFTRIAKTAFREHENFVPKARIAVKLIAQFAGGRSNPALLSHIDHVWREIVNVHCPHCQRPLTPPSKASGEPIRCPNCGGLATLPDTARRTPASPQFDDELAPSAMTSQSEVTIQWRPRKKPVVGVRTTLAGLAVCVLAIGAVWTVQEIKLWLNRVRQAEAQAQAAPATSLESPAAPDPSRPTWLPEAALHAQLGDEVGLQRYRLRIPKQFSQFTVRQPAWLPKGGSFYANSWLQMPERQALIVVSVTNYPRHEAPGDDLEAALERFYDRLQRNVRAANFSSGSSEIGFLAGERFIKGSFSGRIKFDQDLPRVDRSGQVLIHLDGISEVAIYYFCNRDADRELFKLLEASLLTLRTSQP